MICGLVNPKEDGNYVDVVGVYDNILTANRNAKAIYSTVEAYAVDLTQYPVTINCMWDGRPYRLNENGEKEYYEYIPTYDEMISEFAAKLNEQKAATDDLILAIADAEFGGNE